MILLFNLMGSQTSIIAAPTTVETNWHTFLGSEPAPGDSDDDRGYDVAVDSSGYAYVVGQSLNDNWGGTLIISHALGLDGFLAKLDREGALLWHTFIGGSETDSARAITIDADDNLFVVGTSNDDNWGTAPISEAKGAEDVFVAKFNPNGARQWFTFIGMPNNASNEYGNAIAVDDAGNIYVGGTSVANPYLAKLNSAGEFQWQRVVTSTEGDIGQAFDIAVSQDNAVYLTGLANYGEWHGASPPVRSHSGYPGESDAFVAKFDGDNGILLWHTFLGAADWEDEGYAIGIQTTPPLTPTIYIAGWSGDDWGTPIHPHAGTTDAFVAQLNGANGSLHWHTFMGNATYPDAIHAIALDGADRLFVAGDSQEGWGQPVFPHPEGGASSAAFVAALSLDGHFLGNTFLGGGSDTASGIALRSQGAIYVSGSSSAEWRNPYWGPPIRAFSGEHDAFVAGLGVQSVTGYWVYAPIILKH